MSLEEQLIAEIKAVVISDNVERYCQFVAEKDPSTIRNAEWRTFVSLLQENEASETIRTIFRQVMLDVLSNTLAVLDGSSCLATMRDDFRIFYGSKELERTLADTLLESEE
jgi:hypothetical protein